MAEKLLDGPDVVAVFEEVGGEGMAKGVAVNRFRDGGEAGRVADRALDGGFVEMVPDECSGFGVRVFPVRRGRPIAIPENVRIDELTAERFGQCGATSAPTDLFRPDAESSRYVRREAPRTPPGRTVTAVLVFPSLHAR